MNPHGIFTFNQISLYQEIAPAYLKFLLWRMSKNGWIEKRKKSEYCLTIDGRHRAEILLASSIMGSVFGQLFGGGRASAL